MKSFGVNLVRKSKVFNYYFFCLNELANDRACRSGHQGLMLKILTTLWILSFGKPPLKAASRCRPL